MADRIELLSVALLEECRDEVARLRKLADGLAIALGWHYLLDLAWVLRELPGRAPLRVLDAGAGLGVLQWRLAEDGHEVISVDRERRGDLPLQFRARYDVGGLRTRDLRPWPRAALATALRPWLALRTLYAFARGGVRRRPGGRVMLYDQDLTRLEDVADASLDAVVSVSALEHNAPEQLPSVVAELMRVLKPGGVLLATLGAARDADWFHEPSRGWCYTEGSLRRLFGLDPRASSDFAEYDRRFAALRASRELRRGLALAYGRSARNGMPWGVWDPRYHPVAVRREKHA